jgi:predicted DNA-binding protein with PD1-like motif
MKLFIIQDTGYFDINTREEYELKFGDECEILNINDSLGFKCALIRTPHNHTFKLGLAQDENNPWFKIVGGDSV